LNPQELKDFEDAKKLVRNQRYAQALPVLQILHKRYPEDGEVERVLDYCQSFITTPQNKKHQDPWEPTTITPVVAFTQTQNNNSYLAPLLGSIVMAVSVFLPWFNVSVAAGILSAEASVNGLGSYSGSALLVNAASRSGGGFSDGYFVIGLAILAAVVSYTGLINKTHSAWKVAVLFGVVAAGIIIYDWVNFTSKSSTLNDSGTTSGVSTAIQVGPGLMVGILGAVVIIIGSLAINSRASNN
jgi:hypothetical protein